MGGFKSFLTSRTIISALVGLAALGLRLAGFGDALPDEATVVNVILQLVEGVSFMAAIAFRVAAKKQIAA